MAMTTARERGFEVDPEVTTLLMKAHLATLAPHRENLMQTNCTVPGLATTATYALISMKDAGYARDALTDAIIHCLAAEQRPDGRWRAGDTRPPLGTGEFATTALSLRTIQLYLPEGRKSELQAHIDRARRWLSERIPLTNDDRVFKILGLAWAKAPARDIQSATELLLRDQRSDGGWAQLPEMSSDAFATAQALVALYQGGRIRVTEAAWQRGLQFLLKRQLEDGSWHVRSRAFGFQPYFESGFPHGHDQWISAAATSWATIALVYAAVPNHMARTAEPRKTARRR
jgi:squalene cyclase